MPTPSPIMMPRNVAKSGIARTLLSRLMMATPMPMPNRATPTGNPIARTEPNATIRMTIANARPRTSEDGSSNSAKMNPPSSTCSPSISGTPASISFAISVARGKSMSSGSSTLAYAILPASGPCDEISISPPGA